MIIRTELLQTCCTKILGAVDSNSLAEITETLELITKDNFLYINVTNKEYYAQVKLDVGENVNFHATVNAELFLKLISQVTTDTVELTISDTNIIIKANGTYKIPLIMGADGKLIELPEITINNVTNEFTIPSSILKSILTYNSKELTKGTVVMPVQRLYYVDEKGAITFTNGACVNSFTLEKPVKLLLNNRLVKLFKLFKEENVQFTLGYDSISDDIIQTKVRFVTPEISLTAILSCDDSLLGQVPVAAIRGRATAEYPYSVNIDKDSLLQTINRLLLFNSSNNIKPYSTLEFNKDTVTIYDANKTNKETIYYNNTVLDMEEPYTAILDLMELKSTVESCTDSYLNINFGDSQAFILTRGNIANIIPECRLN